MSWTEIIRPQHWRDLLRYASDTTDTKWLFLSFFLPPSCHLGCPREVDLRTISTAIKVPLATFSPVYPLSAKTLWMNGKMRRETRRSGSPSSPPRD